MARNHSGAPSRAQQGILLVAVTLSFLTAHAARPAASYRILELDGPVVFVGFAAAAYALASALTALPVGRTADRVGTKVPLITGLAVMGLACAGSALATSPAALVALQGVLGTGQVASALGFQSIIASGPADSRDRTFGHFAVATSIGQFSGPLMTGYALTVGAGLLPLPYPTSWAFAAAMAVAATSILVTSLLRVPRRAPRTAAPDNRSATRVVITIPEMRQVLLTSVLVHAGIDLLIAYLPVVGQDRGISPSQVGWLLGLRASAAMVSRLAYPVLLRRMPRTTLVRIAMLASSAALLSLFASGTLLVMATSVAVIGFFLGLGAPITMAWAADVAPADLRATALAVRITANRAGQIVIPMTVGWLAAISPAVVFLAAGLLLGGGGAATRPQRRSRAE